MMGIKKLTVLQDYPKTLSIPRGSIIRIYETDQYYLVEFLPNNDDKPRIVCPPNTNVHFDENDIPPEKQHWIKIINEEDKPVEITIEFYLPGNPYKKP